MALTIKITDFIHMCKYGNQYCDINQETVFSFDSIIKNKQEFIYDLNFNLPEELNAMYSLISNPIVYPNWKTFSFMSYNDITSQLSTTESQQTEFIKLGEIYQGMGYYVTLMYNITHQFYYFVLNGGSNYYEQEENNISSLNNIIIETLNNEHPYKLFNSLIDVINFIYDKTTEYYDDSNFYHSNKIIKAHEL